MPDQVKIKFGPARYNSPKAIRNQIDDAKREAIEESDGGGGDTFVTDVIGEQIVTPILPLTTWLAPAVTSAAATATNIICDSTNRGRIFFVNFVINSVTIVDQIAFNVAVANSTSKVRLGIYSEVNGRPDALLTQTGDVSMTWTGVKLGLLSQPIELQPGRYYVACVLRDTINTTAAVTAKTAGYASPNKYHPHAGAALAAGGWPLSPCFYTTASTFTTGTLPATTSSGTILNVDVTGSGLNLFPTVAIRSGIESGFNTNITDTPSSFMIISPPIAGLTGGAGDVVFWSNGGIGSDKILQFNLSTGVQGSTTTRPVGYTGTSLKHLTHADSALWISSGTGVGGIDALSYYNGSGWTEYLKNDLVNQAYGLTGARTNPYLGMHDSYAGHASGGKLYAVVNHDAAANYKVVTIDKTGVSSNIDIPAGFPWLYAVINGSHLWVYGVDTGTNNEYCAYYNGTTWSSVYLFATTGTSNHEMQVDPSTADLVRFSATIRSIDTLGNVSTYPAINFNTLIGSEVWPYAVSDTSILLIKRSVGGSSATQEIRNYTFSNKSVSALTIEPDYNYVWWEYQCPTTYNGNWVVLRQANGSVGGTPYVYEIRLIPAA